MLERPAEARRELERAWKAGYRAPEVSYSLGLALGQLYQRALSELPPADDQQTEALRRASLARELREPALAYLKGAVGLQSEAPEYVEGLIALHERRWQQALDKAHAAEVRVPWMYEAHTLEGDIRLTLAKERWVDGGPDDALAELDRAGQAYETAAGIARSSAGALHGDCLRFVMAAEIESEHDCSPAAAVDGAMSACARAAQALPGDGEIWADEIDAMRRLARYQQNHNGDPAASWQRADELGKQGKALAPNNVRLIVSSGYVERDRASWEQDNGKDPRAGVDRAITAGRAALALDPNAHEAYHLMSDAWLVRGDWESTHGLDPRGSYETTSEMGQRAWSLSPQGFKIINTIGLGYLSRGMWEANNGLDPRPALQQAAVTIEKVVRANPNVDYGYNNLCVTFQTLGEYEIKRGIDPMATLARAQAPCEKAIAIDSEGASTQQSLGAVLVDIAIWQRDAGDRSGAADGEGARDAAAIDRARSWLRARLFLARRGRAGGGALGRRSRRVAGGGLRGDGGGVRAIGGVESVRSGCDARAGRALSAARRVECVAPSLGRRRRARGARASDARARDQCAPRDGGARGGRAAPRGGARASGERRRAEAAAAHERLYAALGFDGNLEREARPLFDEATKLMNAR